MYINILYIIHTTYCYYYYSSDYLHEGGCWGEEGGCGKTAVGKEEGKVAYNYPISALFALSPSTAPHTLPLPLSCNLPLFVAPHLDIYIYIYYIYIYLYDVFT